MWNVSYRRDKTGADCTSEWTKGGGAEEPGAPAAEPLPRPQRTKVPQHAVTALGPESSPGFWPWGRHFPAV